MKNKITVITILVLVAMFTVGMTYVVAKKNRPHIVSEEDNLIIINDTSIDFKTVQVARGGSGPVAMYADGSLIKRGDKFGFEIEKFDKVGFSFNITDKDENIIFESERLFGDFKEGKVEVLINEDENGKLYAEIEK